MAPYGLTRRMSAYCFLKKAETRTFYLNNSASQNIFLGLLVLEGGNNFFDDGLRKVGLLALLNLLLIAHPAVEDRLEL